MQSSIADTMMAGVEPTVQIVIQAVEQGGYTAECIDLPGCCSEGETEQEAEANIRKAIDACLSVIFEDSLNRIKPHVPNPNLPGRHETIAVTLPRLQECWLDRRRLSQSFRRGLKLKVVRYSEN
jgi:predicted RNase H-like HicB family nuclease